MIADHVKCNYCNEVMYVVVGTEVCPKCKVKGMLEWVDENEPEIEVSDEQIINLDDYENVINDTEKSIDMEW